MDSRALVKRYVEEEESPAVLARIDSAPIVGTALITRVEVPAALKKAVRTGDMDPNEAEEADREFLEDWPDITRVGMTDALAARAGNLAWQHDLRAYDAAQPRGGAHVARRTRRPGRRDRLRVLRHGPAPGSDGGRPRDVARIGLCTGARFRSARSKRAFETPKLAVLSGPRPQPRSRSKHAAGAGNLGRRRG